MQGALSEVAGVEKVVVTFHRREALVRYDSGKTNVLALMRAVAETGGYAAALKSGPYPVHGALEEWTGAREYALPSVEKYFDHTALSILSPEQVRRDLDVLRKPGEPVPDGQDRMAVFIALWSRQPEVLPVHWLQQFQIVNPDSTLVSPVQWVPQAAHMESDGTGSVAGVLFFPGSEKTGGDSVTVRFSGLPANEVSVVRLGPPDAGK